MTRKQELDRQRMIERVGEKNKSESDAQVHQTTGTSRDLLSDMSMHEVIEERMKEDEQEKKSMEKVEVNWCSEQS